MKNRLMVNYLSVSVTIQYMLIVLETKSDLGRAARARIHSVPGALRGDYSLSKV